MDETLHVFEVRDSGPNRSKHFSKSAFGPTPEGGEVNDGHHISARGSPRAKISQAILPMFTGPFLWPVAIEELHTLWLPIQKLLK